MKPDPYDQNKFKAVDDYFRQGAEEIPVVFDAAHWESLASALDAAQQPEKTITVKRSRPRLGKGWWVSGIFVLSLMVAWWTWQSRAAAEMEIKDDNYRIQNAPSTEAVISPSDLGPDKQDTREIPINLPSGNPNGQPISPAKKQNNGDNTPAQTEAQVLQPLSSDSTLFLQKTAEQPKDSLSAVPKTPKKKKNLFW